MINNEDIVKKIAQSKKKTSCKVILNCKKKLVFKNAKVFVSLPLYIVYGDYEDIKDTLKENEKDIEDMVIENQSRNSALPLLNTLNINARIEPGAIIRDLDLRKPIYKQVAAYGHFGRNDLDLPWERTDKAEILRKEALGE